MDSIDKIYWDDSENSILSNLHSSVNGLPEIEAANRLRAYGFNKLQTFRKLNSWILFLKQFYSPITVILIGAAILSFFLHDTTDSGIIMVIIVISASLSFFQEKGAADALNKLLSLVQITTMVLRDGHKKTIPLEDIVAGDIVLLSAGNTVPGDCRLIESNNLFLNEATLTGETFPAEKKCGRVPVATSISGRSNCIFLGTHVISGTAKAVVINTGASTEFGKISQHMRKLKPENRI